MSLSWNVGGDHAGEESSGPVVPIHGATAPDYSVWFDSAVRPEGDWSSVLHSSLMMPWREDSGSSC